jgi:hypothetical protein
LPTADETVGRDDIKKVEDASKYGWDFCSNIYESQALGDEELPSVSIDSARPGGEDDEEI